MFDTYFRKTKRTRSELQLLKMSKGIRMVRKYRDKLGRAKVAGGSVNANLDFQKKRIRHPRQYSKCHSSEPLRPETSTFDLPKFIHGVSATRRIYVGWVLVSNSCSTFVTVLQPSFTVKVMALQSQFMKENGIQLNTIKSDRGLSFGDTDAGSSDDELDDLLKTDLLLRDW